MTYIMFNYRLAPSDSVPARSFTSWAPHACLFHLLTHSDIRPISELRFGFQRFL